MSLHAVLHRVQFDDTALSFNRESLRTDSVEVERRSCAGWIETVSRVLLTGKEIGESIEQHVSVMCSETMICELVGHGFDMSKTHTATRVIYNASFHRQTP